MQSQVYRIRVREYLDTSWSEWFEDLAVAVEADGTSVLTGSLDDQAALCGLIHKICSLGLSLISVESLGAADHVYKRH